MACYRGPNPVKTDEQRMVIWKWAKEKGGINDGFPIESVRNAINIKFFGGMGKPEWIDDVITGRHSPLREVANDMWRKQYNARILRQQARDLSRMENMGPVGKWLRRIWTAPRTLAVFGHGVVFPVTHAGDLVFRPQDWGTFINGALKTYRGAFDKAYTGRILSQMEADERFDLGLRSGVDMGTQSHPAGLISRYYHGPAQRAWDLLTSMRFELWKKAMDRHVKPGMSNAEVLDIGKNLAEWANHATGSGKGPIASVGGEALFGPKLTQSKLNRIIADPIKTVKTFRDWNNATAGEKAVAWERLSGATQFLVTNLGFLGVNAGLLAALGLKDKINISDPTKGDFLSFKAGGIRGNVPGLHTEVKTLAKILNTAFLSRQQLRGDTKFTATAKTLGQYGMAKLTPAIQRGLEFGLGQDWLGRPLPWSSEKGTPSRPKLTYGEYAAQIGPIPLEGPIGFVYDQLKKGGMSALDATALTKALIIGGFGAPGFKVTEDIQPRSRFNPTTATGIQ